MEIIYGKSLLYKEGAEDKRIKEVNDYLTILYYLKEENKKELEKKVESKGLKPPQKVL
jgi:hypothetical protein|tara:strand:+ start:230 stop:403 length:174 start_codon:yes stop_codon:yes gene_type:complete